MDLDGAITERPDRTPWAIEAPASAIFSLVRVRVRVRVTLTLTVTVTLALTLTLTLTLASLLQQHAARLDATAVVGVLPGHLSLASLRPLWAAMLPQHTHRMHEAQMRQGLARAELTQAQQELLRMRGRRVVITQERACAASGQPVANRVFVVHPSNSVVLFGARREVNSGSHPSASACTLAGRRPDLNPKKMSTVRKSNGR